MRAEFETWAKTAGKFSPEFLRRSSLRADWYATETVTFMYRAWKAAHAAGFEAGIRAHQQSERDEFKIWWERDSKALSAALGQRDTARAVAEDNRARYAVAESQRDETMLRLANQDDEMIALQARRDELAEALRKLSFVAMTSGGTAGRDTELCAAVDAATHLLARIDAEAKP
jgi:hypothetical protein